MANIFFYEESKFVIMKTLYRYLLFISYMLPLVLSADPSALAINSDPYFKTLQKRLIQDGFDKGRIKELYSRSQVYFETKGVSRFILHREATLNYDQFSSPVSIRKARQYMQKHQSILASTSKSYGVDKEIITAIILVESQLGNFLGGPSTVNMLSTMASLADPDVSTRLWNELARSHKLSRKRYEKWARKKSNWAYTELKAFLKYTAGENIDPVTVYGSYAGALGIAQFMPSSILAFAKDGDNDGQIDLFNHADSIASIASYLKHYGWHAGIDKKRAKKVIYRYNKSNYYVDAVLKISVLLKG